MLSFMLAGVFLAVVAAYACTEYQLVLYDAWHRVRLGESFVLPIILAANLISFIVLWSSASMFVLASGTDRYPEATAMCGFARCGSPDTYGSITAIICDCCTAHD